MATFITDSEALCLVSNVQLVKCFYSEIMANIALPYSSLTETHNTFYY